MSRVFADGVFADGVFAGEELAAIDGDLSQTLGQLTIAAAASTQVTGQVAALLGAINASAAASARVTGSSAITLDMLQLSTTGGGASLGNASITLGSATLNANGRVLTLSQDPSPLVAYVPAVENLATVQASNFIATVWGHAMPILERFTKQPADVQDYDIDFTEYLDALTDTAAIAVVEAEPGIDVVTHLILGKVVKVWLSGGTSGQKYKVTIRLTTTGGRTKEVEIIIIVRER